MHDVKATDVATPLPRLGLREAGKADRLLRLKEATKHILLTRGYDAATTREISTLARVSVGTLFVYAKDKRDLLYLVVNDELDPVAEAAGASAPKKGAALDIIGAYLRPWYAYFGANLAIGRCAFRELAYYQHHPEDQGEQAVRLRRRMKAQESFIGETLRAARERGELAFHEPTALIGGLLHDIYLADIRAWLYGDAPNVDDGVAWLRTRLAVVLSRLGARGL